MPLSATQQRRLTTAAEQAVLTQAATSFPAEIIVAQWALESGWGKSQPGNNCFGHKAPVTLKDNSRRQLLSTKEWFTAAQLAQFLALGDGRTAIKDNVTAVNGRSRYTVLDWFRKYVSLSDAFTTHANKLQRGRYQPGWDQYKLDLQLKGLAQAIHIAGYATAPDYADNLIRLFSQTEVKTALKAARKPAVKKVAG